MTTRLFLRHFANAGTANRLRWCTEKKKEDFLHIKGNSEWIGCKVIFEEIYEEMRK
jgi:hypothetical protein